MYTLHKTAIIIPFCFSTHSNVAPSSDEEFVGENQEYQHESRSNESEIQEGENTTPRFTPRNNVTRKNPKSTDNSTIEEYFKKKMADKSEKTSSIDSFFKAISDTVSKFPPLSQNRIKMQVSQLVFAEEQKILMSQMESESRQQHRPTNNQEFSFVQPENIEHFQHSYYNRQGTHQHDYGNSLTTLQPQSSYNSQPYSPESLVSQQSESSL